jgi:hypothetical protein
MGWYRNRGSMIDSAVIGATMPNLFTQERTKCPIRQCRVEVFRELVQSDHTEFAIVFPHEGTYDEEHETFVFDYEYSNQFPVQITKEVAFKANRILFTFDKAGHIEFDREFSGPQGRELLFKLLSKAMGSGPEGGSKVPTKPIPPEDGPGVKLEQEVEHAET